ncbi:MAG TPA: thioredoxin-dependent thiol peroxidase [Elusimicrobiota bacterium]|nr:thioredoxin-dependent thiol peroxidase [Elusimicrobiota bacterium]HND64789.1 thioredoxin-dependent thiol peroxidase [Elusimicrobiota bacterium]HNG44526.1 thioredoxin-dependent thiol peroxidase [Elusimicrobiota bacterium]
MLEIGDKAPAFTALDQDGKKISLSDFKGKQVVLYFYPKDMTPGCTVEACAFRDGHGALQKAGAVVLGVSKDPVPSHKKFSDKFSLPFSLLADEDLKIMKAYGAWGEKSLYGRKFMGTLRVTYIINSNGKIKAVFKKVKPAGHDREILALL